MWSHEYYHGNRTPPGFPYTRTLPGATLWSDLEIWHDKRSNSSDDSDVIIPTKMFVERSPTLMCPQGVKDMYVNSAYLKVHGLKQKIKADVEGVDKIIRDRGIHAFRVIETLDKQRYYVAYDATASVWVYQVPDETTQNTIKTEDDKAKGKTITSIFQLGKYSSGTDVAGTIKFTFKHQTTGDVSCFLAAKVVEVLQSSLQKEDTHTDIILQFLVDQAIVYEADQIDWGEKISKFGTGCLTTSTALAVTTALTSVADWILKKYSVKLGIFNWCCDNTLVVSESYLDNAVMVQVDRDVDENTTIKIPEAPTLIPPMFEPLIPFGAACHYLTIFFDNQYNFLSGCGFALRFEIGRQKTNRGFFYAFDCKRFKNNRQKACEIIPDLQGGLEQYYKTPKEWNENPLKFYFETETIPVSITLNALNLSDHYFPYINFGYKNQ